MFSRGPRTLFGVRLTASRVIEGMIMLVLIYLVYNRTIGKRSMKKSDTSFPHTTTNPALDGSKSKLSDIDDSDEALVASNKLREKQQSLLARSNKKSSLNSNVFRSSAEIEKEVAKRCRSKYRDPAFIHPDMTTAFVKATLNVIHRFIGSAVSAESSPGPVYPLRWLEIGSGCGLRLNAFDHKGNAPPYNNMTFSISALHGIDAHRSAVEFASRAFPSPSGRRRYRQMSVMGLNVEMSAVELNTSATTEQLETNRYDVVMDSQNAIVDSGNVCATLAYLQNVLFRRKSRIRRRMSASTAPKPPATFFVLTNVMGFSPMDLLHCVIPPTDASTATRWDCVHNVRVARQLPSDHIKWCRGGASGYFVAFVPRSVFAPAHVRQKEQVDEDAYVAYMFQLEEHGDGLDFDTMVKEVARRLPPTVDMVMDLGGW
eukprot:PhM_4_TR5425/c0_g1_i1/m.84074